MNYLEVKHLMNSIYSDDEEMVQDTLESLLPIIEGKAEDVARYIRELQLIAGTQKAEAASLAEAAKKTSEKADKIMANVAQCLKQLEQTELQAGAYKFKFTKGREVVQVDEEKLPKEYKTIQTIEKPMDKNELKKLIKAGTQIEGVSLVRNPDSLSLK
ncbi:MAG: siphovirus Gp157 family protein [Psychrobacillus sp.]